MSSVPIPRYVMSSFQKKKKKVLRKVKAKTQSEDAKLSIKTKLRYNTDVGITRLGILNIYD